MPKFGYKQTKEHRTKIKENHAKPWLGRKRGQMSLGTKEKLSISHSGEKSVFWKGDKAGYFAKHIWINTHFGNATKCENREKQILNFPCMVNVRTGKLSANFTWAKKKNREYTRNVEDYYQLCKGCHIRYDKKQYEKQKEEKPA